MCVTEHQKKKNLLKTWFCVFNSIFFSVFSFEFTFRCDATHRNRTYTIRNKLHSATHQFNTPTTQNEWRWCVQCSPIFQVFVALCLCFAQLHTNFTIASRLLSDATTNSRKIQLKKKLSFSYSIRLNFFKFSVSFHDSLCVWFDFWREWCVCTMGTVQLWLSIWFFLKFLHRLNRHRSDEFRPTLERSIENARASSTNIPLMRTCVSVCGKFFCLCAYSMHSM